MKKRKLNSTNPKFPFCKTLTFFKFCMGLCRWPKTKSFILVFLTNREHWQPKMSKTKMPKVPNRISLPFLFFLQAIICGQWLLVFLLVFLSTRRIREQSSPKADILNNFANLHFLTLWALIGG